MFQSYKTKLRYIKSLYIELGQESKIVAFRICFQASRL